MNLNVRVISFILSLCLFNCGESLASEKVEEQATLTEIQNPNPIESKKQSELNE